MQLQTKIQQDLKIATTSNNVQLRDTLKVIVGEMQRQPKKELNDGEVVKILKSLQKNEQELIKATGQSASSYLTVLSEYIPTELSESDIMKWIGDNVDFSSLKNKMQAVGLVTKHFGPLVDGNVVKKIITERC